VELAFAFIRDGDGGEEGETVKKQGKAGRRRGGGGEISFGEGRAGAWRRKGRTLIFLGYVSGEGREWAWRRKTWGPDGGRRRRGASVDFCI